MYWNEWGFVIKIYYEALVFSQILDFYLLFKLIANRWAWVWCLLEWVVVPGWATNLEQRALGRACRYPWPLCERQPPIRHCHTEQVRGDTYQPNTNQIHQWGRDGEGEKAVQMYGSALKTNCTTSHGWNAQHVWFEKPCMSHRSARFPDHRWPALTWF